MHISQTIREQVISRLMMRHGLSYEQAALAWEEYKLTILAPGMRRMTSANAIEDN